MKIDNEAYEILKSLALEAKNINDYQLDPTVLSKYQKTWSHLLLLILDQCTVENNDQFKSNLTIQETPLLSTNDSFWAD